MARTTRQELKTFVDDAHFCLGILLANADDNPVDSLLLEYLEELADAQHDRVRRSLALRMRDQITTAGLDLRYGAFDDLIETEMESA